MRENISFNVGNLILINKVDREYKFFDNVMGCLKGKTKHLVESMKAFINNRLDKCVSINQLTEIYPEEWFQTLKFKEKPKQRTFYRDLERIGINHVFIIEKYQQLMKKNNLFSKEQFPDFSSSYFEGQKAELGALGYSRDSQPGKKQIVFGVQTGINGIPSALTIQKGNVQDKQHMKFMLKTVEKILDKDSLLVFDCGGYTKENKRRILDMRYNYLSLVPRNNEVYKSGIKIYKQSPKGVMYINGIKYKCVKIKKEKEIFYVFHSQVLYKKLKRNRNQKFKNELNKNDPLIKKVEKGKEISRFLSRKGEIITKGVIQKQLGKIKNSYITGIEGFFILESSVDDEPYKILRLYKKRDIVEKLIRNMKEGTELRPINCITKEAIIGYLVIIFLTNCLVRLSHYLNKDIVDKNLKLLKKKLGSLTVTVIYDQSVFRFSVLSNISPEIRQILGDSLKEFREKPPDWM